VATGRVRRVGRAAWLAGLRQLPHPRERTRPWSQPAPTLSTARYGFSGDARVCSVNVPTILLGARMKRQLLVLALASIAFGGVAAAQTAPSTSPSSAAPSATAPAAPSASSDPSATEPSDSSSPTMQGPQSPTPGPDSSSGAQEQQSEKRDCPANSDNTNVNCRHSSDTPPKS